MSDRTARGEQSTELAHTGTAPTVAEPIGSERTLTDGSDGGVHVVDVIAGTRRVLTGHAGAIERVITLPDGRIATAGEDGTVRTWELPGGRELAKVELSEVMTQLVYADRTKQLIAGDVRGRTFYLDPSNLSFGRFGWMNGGILSLALSPDGRSLLAGSSQHLQIEDLDSGTSRRLGGGHAFGAVAFARDGREIAAAADDGTVRTWPDDLPRDEAGLRAWIEQHGVKRGQIRF